MYKEYDIGENREQYSGERPIASKKLIKGPKIKSDPEQRRDRFRDAVFKDYEARQQINEHLLTSDVNI